MYNPDSLAQKIADILDDRKAEQVVVLDISRLSVLADYFVITRPFRTAGGCFIQ